MGMNGEPTPGGEHTMQYVEAHDRNAHLKPVYFTNHWRPKNIINILKLIIINKWVKMKTKVSFS